jgi:hypothetical protein
VRPSLRATPNLSASINGLHPAKSSFAIDLRKASLHSRVVEVQDFNTVTRVKSPQAYNAGPAQAAGTVVENRKIGHVRRLSKRLSILFDSEACMDGTAKVVTKEARLGLTSGL